VCRFGVRRAGNRDECGVTNGAQGCANGGERRTTLDGSCCERAYSRVHANNLGNGHLRLDCQYLVSCHTSSSSTFDALYFRVGVFTRGELNEDFVTGATTKEDTKVTSVLIAAVNRVELYALDEALELSRGEGVEDVVLANAAPIAPSSPEIKTHFMPAVLPGESSGLVTWSLPNSPKSQGNLSNNVRVKQNGIFLGDPRARTTTRASYKSTGANRSGVALTVVARESAYRKTRKYTLRSRNASCYAIY